MTQRSGHLPNALNHVVSGALHVGAIYILHIPAPGDRSAADAALAHTCMHMQQYQLQQKLGNTGGCEIELMQDPTRNVESRDYSASGEVSSGTHVRRAVALVGLASTEAGEALGLTTPIPGTQLLLESIYLTTVS